MYIRPFIACALLACTAAFARPLVIEQPEQQPFISASLAHAGDELIAMHFFVDASSGQEVYTYSANLYRRMPDGEWQFQRTMAFETTTVWVQRLGIAMNSSVAAVAMPSGLKIFERNFLGWYESAVNIAPLPRGQALDLDGSRLLVTETECSARAIEVARGAGGWELAATLPMPAGTCVSALDLDGNRAIVRGQADLQAPADVRIFEAAAGGWSISAELTPHESDPQSFGQYVGIAGGLAMVSGFDRGAHLYRRGAAGWVETGHFEDPDGTRPVGWGQIQFHDGYLLHVCESFNRRSTALCLYRHLADDTLDHVATLEGTRDTPVSLGTMSGRRVFALTGDFGTNVLEFNLPGSFAVPALVQDDFNSGGAARWTPLPGSQFAIANTGTTNVYRQSSLAGDAGALFDQDMTNQSIAADIRLNGVNGNDRWVGLVTRYIDEDNYYYVTLRTTSNRLVLKRIVDGVFSELASFPLRVLPGGSFHVRLESSGSFHAVDVDGQRVIRAYDRSHAHGRPGLRMYRAAADFDNVVVSPGPTSNLIYAHPETLGGTWSTAALERSLAQSSLAGNALRVTGLPRADQVVQATIRVRSFAATGSPWAGLIARYRDANNYYYVTLRKNNRLSLRQLSNGTITELGNVAISVDPNVFYLVRLEAIGDRLRVYLNDVLQLERSGAEVVAGKVGVMTYRTSATFDQYTAMEP